MDEQLHKKWKVRMSPFDCKTIYTSESIELSLLRKVALKITDILKTMHGDLPLLLLEDWHDHDGFIKTGQQINWAELELILSTDSHLKNACPLDFHVKLAIYPDTNDFYFRIGLDDEVDSQGNWFGDFDFTANTATQSLIQKMIKKHFSFEIGSEFSKKYFDEVYGG